MWKDKEKYMGPFVFAAFIGTLLIGLVVVALIKLYEKAKEKEEEIVAHHRDHKKSS